MHYFFRKLWHALITLLGVITIVFFLFNVLGDPAQMMVDQNATQEQVKKIEARYGFDQSKSEQFFIYLNQLSPFSRYAKTGASLVTYDKAKYGGFSFATSNSIWVFKWPYLGTSYQRQGKPVGEIISETLPNTMLLAILAIGLAIFIGILLGTLAGYYKASMLDHVLVFISTIGMSLPSFFSAILFSWVFGYVLHPWTGLEMTGSLLVLDDYGEQRQIRLKNIILPAFVLGIRPLAVIVQLVRSGIIDVLGQEYIKTAYAKGLNPFQVIIKHALKNTLNPVITTVSGWFASMLAGAVFVEYIFGWRGLGKEMVTALNTLDIPVVMGGVLVIATLFIIINILVDYLYILVDPKAKPI